MGRRNFTPRSTPTLYGQLRSGLGAYHDFRTCSRKLLRAQPNPTPATGLRQQNLIDAPRAIHHASMTGRRVGAQIMGKDNKFGTFGGVFTPSLLTILGVIMYLRLPWVVGNAGLFASLGLIAVAHVISVCTGLSISSIATDKSVGAGGPYYIVSRSLGLPIGGTLGLALFVGLAFSISLYIIGFAESFLRFLELEPSINNIRICGSLTLLGLTIITFISTALAIKTQYVILTLIVLSLVSILTTPGPAPSEPALTMAPEGPSLGTLFGIFFPAVTGFTAGVNMSGDLRDPKTSIPRGTMASIVLAALVYLALAIFLAYRVDRTLLVDDPAVLVSISSVGGLVLAGIWGATLSSALGSILGAPRILQAVSKDGITPAVFAKGYGKTDEPRNALFLAFFIGLAGILIAELDVIARVVSMVFLTTYGFLNMTCAIESWTSPDFRPDFRIWRGVSVLGAVTCVLVMFRLDMAAMAGAVVLMATLYAWLARRQLKLESGDAWEGVWASLVRAGLYRLSQQEQHGRNWRPNVMLFRRPTAQLGAREGELLDFAQSLVSGNGLLSDFRLIDARSQSNAKPVESTRLGVFTHTIVVPNQAAAESQRALRDTVAGLCRYHGFAGLNPNTVLVSWDEYREDPEALRLLLAGLREFDYNQLIFGAAGDQGGSKEVEDRIDIWWHPEAGNFSFALALIRFITNTARYQQADVRFLLLCADQAAFDVLRTRARRALKQARVAGELRLIHVDRPERRLADWVLKESSHAKLTIVAVPNDDEGESLRFSELTELSAKLHDVLFTRSASRFEEVLTVGQTLTTSLLPGPRDSARPQAVSLPTYDNPNVAELVEAFGEHCSKLVETFEQQCAARIFATRIELLEELRTGVEKQFNGLERLQPNLGPRRQQRLIQRVQGSFFASARQTLKRFRSRVLPEEEAMLAGRIEAFIENSLVRHPAESQLRIVGVPDDFVPRAGDSRELRRLKRRRRWAAFLSRTPPSHFVAIGRLERYYFDQLLRQVLAELVRRLTQDTHRLAVRIGKLLNSSEASLTLLGGEVEQGIDSFLEAQKERTIAHYESLIDHEKQRAKRLRTTSRSAMLACVEQFGSDVARLDSVRFSQRERRLPKDAPAVVQQLREIAGPWLEGQQKLLERAELALTIASVQHRLKVFVRREQETLRHQLQTGILAQYRAFMAKLDELQQVLARQPLQIPEVTDIPFGHPSTTDHSPLFDRLTLTVARIAEELPESVETLTDASVEQLEVSGSGDLEVFELSVRSLVKFLIETELVGSLQQALERLPVFERRAAEVGYDVARLVTFQLDELRSQLNEAETEAETEEGREDGQTQALLTIDSSRERLKVQFEQLQEAVESLLTRFDERLTSVLEKTNTYELTQHADSLLQSLRLARGRRAVSGARGALDRTLQSIKHVAVDSVYRASSGWLWARQHHDADAVHATHRIRELVEHHNPDPHHLDQLPFYYRQLFLGQSALSDTFWVDRPTEVGVGERALASYARGARGALLLTGERFSGKSALWQHLQLRLPRGATVFRVHPRPGGTSQLGDFHQAMSEALGESGTHQDALRALGASSVVVLDDLELWWGRHPGGLQVIDAILELVAEYGDRCLFVLGINRFAYDVLRRVRPLDEVSLAVLECGPFDAKALKQVITLRHSSTGARYEYGGRSQDALSELETARLFARHFNYCRGLVGVALQTWLACVEAVDGERLAIRAPASFDSEAVRALSVPQKALLLELILHKQIHRERLSQIVWDGSDLQVQLASLQRLGLVTQPRPQVFEVNRFLTHLLTDGFRSGGLLP